MKQNLQNNKRNRPLNDAQKALLAQLKDITNSDYRRLRSRINGIFSIKKEEEKQAVIEEIEADLTACKSRYLTRKQQADQLKIEYPDLPVF